MSPLQCERSRSWVSLDLDGALSEFEAVQLDRHLDNCAACRAFAADTRGATALLRAAPLEQPTRQVALSPRLLPRRRRTTAVAVAAAAAGLAAALVLHPAAIAPDRTAPSATPVARPAGLAIISYDAANLGVRRRTARDA